MEIGSRVLVMLDVNSFMYGTVCKVKESSAECLILFSNSSMEWVADFKIHRPNSHTQLHTHAECYAALLDGFALVNGHNGKRVYLKKDNNLSQLVDFKTPQSWFKVVR